MGALAKIVKEIDIEIIGAKKLKMSRGRTLMYQAGLYAAKRVVERQIGKYAKRSGQRQMKIEFKEK